MDKSLSKYSKKEIFRINEKFISEKGSFFDKGYTDYEDRFDGYINYVKSVIKITSWSYEDVAYLLSVIQNQQAFHSRINMNINAIEDVVADALKVTMQRYVRQLKKGRINLLDVIIDFKTAKRALQIGCSKESGRSILGFAEIELVLLEERQRLSNEIAEQKRKHAEELRALRELKREKEQAEKDAAKAQEAIKKNKEALERAKTNEQIEKLRHQIAELETALQRAIERKERAISMAQQTRCGYVYIISNIGSFGEGVYKIGMTRRLDPMDRVRELGDASVPFPFDVHAMIYTEDAPGLESHLHKVFENKKVNAVNWRKEYFRVTLDEVRREVETYGIHCQWADTAEAGQWRESEAMHKFGAIDEQAFAQYLDEHPEEKETLKTSFAYDPFEELED